MDCEACEKSLMDLLYDELDESAAKETRAHVEGCEACRGALAKLEMGRAFARKLELEPAPPLGAVLRAAREQAAANRAARDEAAAPAPAAPGPRDDVRADEGGFSGWLRWLGAMVMGPQLGVATVLLLVVGIGLWYLPQISGGSGRGPMDVLEPEPPPTSETTALAPAEPLQLTHDPRTGRVVTVEDGTPEPRTPRPESPSARPERPGSGATPPTTETRVATAPEVVAEVERTVPSDEGGAGRVQDDSLPELSTAAGAYEGSALPPVAPSPSPPSIAPEWAAPNSASQASTTSESPSPAPYPAPPTSPAPSGPAPTYGGGLGASASSGGRSPSAPGTGTRAESQTEAEALAGGPRGDELAAAALHGQARQLAAAGRCADAVGRYEQLVSRYPSYPEGTRASVEVAECMRRIGRASQARVVLDRASRSPVPSVAAAARRQMVEMDAEDRAARAVTAEPASE